MLAGWILMTSSNFNTIAFQLPYLQNKEYKPGKHKKKWMMTFAKALCLQCMFDFFLLSIRNVFWNLNAVSITCSFEEFHLHLICLQLLNKLLIWRLKIISHEIRLWSKHDRFPYFHIFHSTVSCFYYIWKWIFLAKSNFLPFFFFKKKSALLFWISLETVFSVEDCSYFFITRD